MGSRLNFDRGLDFTGAVAANGNPRIHLDGGVTFEELVLETNLAADEFTLVVEVDGELRVRMTGQQLLDREAYDSRAATSGQFVLALADATAKTMVGEGVTGLTTQVGQRVMVSLEIGGTVAAGSPAAVLYTETSSNRPEEFKLFILNEVIKITQVGENEYDGFRKSLKPASLMVRRAFMYGAITKFRLEQDNRAVFGKRNMPIAINTARLLRNGKTAPTACYVYDPIVKGNVIADWLDLWTSQVPTRATITTSNTTDVNALVEYVEDVRMPANA